MFQPCLVLGHELITFFDRSDFCQAKQKFPELSTGLGFRISSQPPASFMLNVIKTSLNGDMRPYLKQGFQCGSLSVGGDSHRIKAIVFEIFKPPYGDIETLFGNIAIRKNQLVDGMHDCHKTTILVEIGAVQDEILEGVDDWNIRRRFLKPIILDSFEF